jgi:hypothetical protein
MRAAPSSSSPVIAVGIVTTIGKTRSAWRSACDARDQLESSGA